MNDEFGAEIKALQDRFDKAPESRIFAPLADAYRKNGEVDRAIELCEKGLERYPEYASAHVILGKCFYDKGATERSRAEFERVIELDPENMVALKFTGDIRISEGDRDGAIECYRRILAIDPTNEDVASTLKGLEEEFREREIDLADDKKVKKADRGGDLATMTLAGIYAAQGYYNKALKIYREILEREPGNSRVSDMIEKIEAKMESTAKELEETFEDEVMTISVEDVTGEVADNTAGPGIGSSKKMDAAYSEDTQAGDGEDGVEIDDDERPLREGSVLGDADELEAVARELEEADRMDSSEEGHAGDGGSAEAEEEEEEGMDNFRRWLKRMHDSGDGKQ